MESDPLTNKFETLRAAIEHLYMTFAVYPLRENKEDSLASLRHLAQFTMTILSDIVQGRRTGYWKHITPWLLDPKTLRTLEHACYTYIDEPFANEFAEAYDALSVMLPAQH